MPDIEKAKWLLSDAIEANNPISVERAIEIFNLLDGKRKRGPNPSRENTGGANARKLRALEEYWLLREKTGLKKHPAIEVIAERYDVNKRTVERWFDVSWMLPYVKKQ